jgi:hypothetical protein
MGSVASYDASVSLIKKQKITIDTVNSDEAIEKFISKNPGLLDLVVEYDEDDANFKKAKKSKLVTIVVNDEDGDHVRDVSMAELGLDMTLGEFIDSEVYEDEKYEEQFTSDYCDADPSYWEFKVATDEKYKANVIKKLKNVDLKAIEKNRHSWSIHEPTVLSNETCLADCSDYIYCSNDNSSSDSFKITQKFIDSLSPGDIIRLDANGDGEHC